MSDNYTNPIQNRQSRLGVLTGLSAVILGSSILSYFSPKDQTPYSQSSAPATQVATSYPTTVPKTQEIKQLTSRKSEEFPNDSDEVLLARLIFGEARGCSYLERVAVGYSVVNRVNDGKKWNGATVREAILLKDKKGVHAYSCLNKFDVNFSLLQKAEQLYPKTFGECLRASHDILSEKVPDPTNGANHYYSPEGMRAEAINKVKRKYKSLIKKSPKKLTYLKNQRNKEISKIKNSPAPKPYWAKPPLKRIGKIPVGKNSKNKTVFSKHVFYK